MNRTLIIIAAIAPFAAFAANSAAKAQEAPKAAFSGQCKDYGASKEACDATGWCHHVTRKAITLPDGKQFTPAAYCAFRSGYKQAWTQQAGK